MAAVRVANRRSVRLRAGDRSRTRSGWTARAARSPRAAAGLRRRCADRPARPGGDRGRGWALPSRSRGALPERQRGREQRTVEPLRCASSTTLRSGCMSTSTCSRPRPSARLTTSSRGLTWSELDAIAGTAVTDPRCKGASVVIYNPDSTPIGALQIGGRVRVPPDAPEGVASRARQCGASFCTRADAGACGRPSAGGAPPYAATCVTRWRLRGSCAARDQRADILLAGGQRLSVWRGLAGAAPVARSSWRHAPPIARRRVR